LYGVPSTPGGKEGVVIVGGDGKLIRIVRFWVADWTPPLLESVAFTVKVAVPFGPVGVPVIWPEESMASPAGKFPALMVRINVPAPPEAVIA
jgi:hypothetical protein